MKTVALSCLASCLIALALARAEDPKPEPLWSRMQTAVLASQDIDQVQALLREGFDVSSPIGCGTYSATDGAVERMNAKMLAFLLKAGAKPKGETLVKAAFCGSLPDGYEMTRLLVEAGADVNFHAMYNATALESACYRGNVKVVALLLAQPGIDLNVVNSDGRTPLITAVEEGFPEIVRLLVEKGADAQLVTARGYSAAKMAAAKLRDRQEILGLVTASSSAPDTARNAPAADSSLQAGR